jgi:hypothetical protein
MIELPIFDIESLQLINGKILVVGEHKHKRMYETINPLLTTFKTFDHFCQTFDYYTRMAIKTHSHTQDSNEEVLCYTF